MDPRKPLFIENDLDLGIHKDMRMSKNGRHANQKNQAQHPQKVVHNKLIR